MALDPDERRFAPKLDPVRVYELGAEVKAAARLLLSFFRESHGGDAYLYEGGMDAVDTLGEVCDEWEQYINDFREED
jgi:hypothetical protein